MKRDSVSASVHMKRDTPLPLLDDPCPFPQLRTYLVDSLFLNIRILHSLKYKHLKKKLFTKK